MTAIISSALSPIIKFWLRSQVTSIDSLEVKISGTNRQILTGQIPEATVSGEHIIYQDLHVTNLYLNAQGIHLNIPQILKGEPLKLMQPMQVDLNMTLAPEDLQKCLASSIVSEAVDNPLPKISDDHEIRTVLEDLLAKLGDQFTLQDLTVVDGGCHCQGVFAIAATDPD